MMPFIVGGLVAASSIMSGISGAGQSKANAMAAQMQQDQQNFQNRWQNEAQNRNLLRQWESQYFLNKQIAETANRQRATGGYYTKEAYKNAASQMSNQTRQANSVFLASASASGLSLDSASTRALLRQSVQDEQKNSKNLRVNVENQMRDLETQYINMLSQRNLNAPEQQTLIDGKAVTVDSSSSIMMTGLITGLLGGTAAGVGAYNQAGGNMGNTVSGKVFG
jgi:hypothetical protein